MHPCSHLLPSRTICIFSPSSVRPTHARFSALRRNLSTRVQAKRKIQPSPNTDPIVYDSRHLARVNRWRRFALVGASLSAGVMGLYCVSLYLSYTRPRPISDHDPISPGSHTGSSPSSQAELTAVHDETASTYDASLGLSEFLMGITSARRKLASKCVGDVLEVSAGTARNLEYYRFSTDGVTSLTLVDLSAEMVEHGKQKWFELVRKGRLVGVKGVPVRFWKGDSAGPMPAPPTRVDALALEKTTVEEAGITNKTNTHSDDRTKRAQSKRGYDTIIQTLGLCSTHSPVLALQNLATHLNAHNPNARILLLEHGLGYFDWLNNILHSTAPAHAARHGCWWDRDMGRIVDESGLRIVSVERRNCGTTWIYELALDSPNTLTDASREVSTTQAPWWTWSRLKTAFELEKSGNDK